MLEQNYQISGSGAKDIASSVEAAIASRALGPGERLPSVRALAAQLGVSTATVADAYRRLRERGLVTGSGRGGTRVRGQRPRSWRRTAPEVAEGVRNLASGNPDPSLLPDLRPALAAAAAQLDEGRARLYGQAESSGQLLARFAQGFRADSVPADDLVIVGGALDGIARALTAHLRPGDLVAVEDPCYCGILDLLDGCDLRPLPVAVDRRGMLPNRLERVLDRVQGVVLTPRLHNPTGAALDAERRDALLAILALRPELLVVEDDHGSLIADVPLHAMAQSRNRGRWAIVRSTSKPLGPDLRVGALSADRLTAARVLETQQATAGWVSLMLQHTVLAALGDPGLVGLLAHARDTYARRRTAFVAALSEHGVHVDCDSGINLWLPVEDETTAAQNLLTRGWAVRSGTAFRLETPPGLRITTATLSPGEAEALAAGIAGVRPPARMLRTA
jgi:DNA-binding transcriptional MocR family regulator